MIITDWSPATSRISCESIVAAAAGQLRQPLGPLDAARGTAHARLLRGRSRRSRRSAPAARARSVRWAAARSPRATTARPRAGATSSRARRGSRRAARWVRPRLYVSRLRGWTDRLGGASVSRTATITPAPEGLARSGAEKRATCGQRRAGKMPGMADLISIAEARERVLAAVRPLPAEDVALDAALGRVLAEDARAEGDLPPFDSSAMDGYAVVAGPAARAAGGGRVARGVARRAAVGGRRGDAHLDRRRGARGRRRRGAGRAGGGAGRPRARAGDRAGRPHPPRRRGRARRRCRDRRGHGARPGGRGRAGGARPRAGALRSACRG